MDASTLFQKIKEKESFLCIGLDTDHHRIPEHLQYMEDPVFAFNRKIIEATHKYTVAYKPNLAFYEALGSFGWKALEKTIAFIRQTDPSLMVIADAKRGDIGNTSKMYARTFFDHLGCDAVTLSPYMGRDTVMPFLEYEDKWVILLALTSNTSAEDFQFFRNEVQGLALYEKVLLEASKWDHADRIMFVVGATKAERFAAVREIVPDHFLLVPGVGAQGGSLSAVARYGMNNRCGLLVNSSRGIIFASDGEDFASAAAAKARQLRDEMALLLKTRGLI
ncbi:MAG: orotidine-5'-phosphate decarboxylase [Chlorobi bacterium]|nr:orotidine-5'-phosphate decarboxylase [Chlorobiota bacterium]